MLVRTAAQILASVQAAGGEQATRPWPGARNRALARLAQEYPDRYRQLYEDELQAVGATVRPRRSAPRPRELKGCPSEAQYRRHLTAGEKCDECREFMRALEAERRRRNPHWGRR